MKPTGMNRLLICMLTLALLLIGCAPASPTASVTPSPELPSPTSTATISWFPATRTPTPLPTIASTPTREVLSGLGDLLYADNFSREELWLTSSGEGGSSRMGNNRLVLSLPQLEQPGTVISLRLDPSLVNFYAQVTAHLSLCRGGDIYSLLFRVSSAGDFYRYSLNCRGALRLERVISGKPFVIKDWTPSADVPLGPPGEVKLSVLAVGREMRFYLNNQFQFNISDHLLYQGGLGLFIRSETGEPMSVAFSDLLVYLAYPPTATPPPWKMTPTATP